MANDIVDAIASASVATRGEYIRDGQGVLEIRKIIDRDMEGGRTFVAEMKVVESSSKGDVDPKTGSPVSPNAPGSVVSFVQPIGPHKHQKVRIANVKAFVCAVVGADPETVTKDDFRDAYQGMTDDQKQMAQGMRVRYTTFQKETRDSKQTHTYARFIHMNEKEGNSPAEIQARREAK